MKFWNRTVNVVSKSMVIVLGVYKRTTTPVWNYASYKHPKITLVVLGCLLIWGAYR